MPSDIFAVDTPGLERPAVGRLDDEDRARSEDRDRISKVGKVGGVLR